jgi:hypothetical protein
MQWASLRFAGRDNYLILTAGSEKKQNFLG